MTTREDNGNKGTYGKIIEFYQLHFMAFDLLTSILVFILLILFMISPDKTLLNWLFETKCGYYSFITTISVTLLGFIITGISILIIFLSEKRFKPIRQNSLHEKIYAVYFRTILYLSILTVLAIVGYLVNFPSLTGIDLNNIFSIAGALKIGNTAYLILFNVLIFYSVVLLSILASFGLYRCMWILKRVIKISIKIPGDDNK
ncbi:hypothetical protein [Methanococcus maripaludis]|uniref:Magnesium-transporting ATPase (P-type) n=1 Tax=Methanococcus maripaludis TaxID=39152 RepID=A0A7J9SF40_METMI|nr:hypothetical protein [Methanococcus maripaludis]MBB6497789.1 magnesium-transporting ATPase (P-type) [Methanococcus maripaludis]